MKPFKNLAPALLLMLAGCSTTTTPTQSAPDADGTLVMREAQVLKLANGGSGRGILTLHGWEHPFEVTNMVLSGVGPGDVQLEGDVYNIASANDFEGTYKVVAAEIEAGKGAEGFWFENANGVRVHIRTRGQDVVIRLNASGSNVRIVN